jgi:four helix bundle protein
LSGDLVSGDLVRALITRSPHHSITRSPHHPITPSPDHPITRSPHHPIFNQPKPIHIMNQEDFNEQFRQRTKKLALAIIALLSPVKYSDALSIIRKQTIRSVTSVAANFRAVCRARSEKERFAKLCIVVEEADETLFWLEMLLEGGFLEASVLAGVLNETEQILKVMSSFRRKMQDSTSRQPPHH